MPVWLYRARLGVLLGHRFVLVHHVGRKTGKPRQAVLEVAGYHPDTGAIDVVAGFGPGSDWYRNLLVHPDTQVQFGADQITVRARPLAPEETAEVLAGYAAAHPRAARRIAASMGFQVDGSEDGYREVGAKLSALRLSPA